MFVLTLHCQDSPGIVAAVATTLSEAGCNIEESAQFHDPFSGHFFMRVVFSVKEDTARNTFAEAFQSIAARFDMRWAINPQDEKVKTLVLVSKADHCLNDLLYRWRTDHLAIDICGVVSNHDKNRALAQERGLPFHHLPVTLDTKAQQEQELRKIIANTGVELIVLARYMQVLSDEFCRDFVGRVINIHHSFLPGFKGGRPYHQAYERGVKIIGATAHFATTDLDEGPIIEQETARVDHSFTPQKMQRLGRDIEAQVLARALDLYTQRRVFVHGNRTVVL